MTLIAVLRRKLKQTKLCKVRGYLSENIFYDKYKKDLLNFPPTITIFASTF